MGVLINKERGGYHFTGIAKLSIVGMLVSFSAAFTSTIWAVYIDSFLNNAVYTSLFSTFLTIVAFISYFVLIPTIEKADKAKLFSYSLIAFILFYIGFALLSNIILLFILSVALTFGLSVRIMCYGLLVKDISENKNLSTNEGLVFTFMNISFVVGPLIAGFLSAKFGFSWVFALSALFILIALLIFSSSKIDGSQGKKRLDKHIIRNFVEFFKNKDRAFAYILRSGVTMWWILIYLFVPLWMTRQGLSRFDIGIFLFAVAVPLISLEFFFSRKAAKVGFRRIFKIGYLLVATIATLCFVFSDTYIILSLLVLASIGLAMLEPTTEAYFFDILKGKSRYRFYGPFNTAIDFGNLIAKFFGTVLLIFLSFNYIFILFAVLMLIMFFLSFKTRRIIESRRR